MSFYRALPAYFGGKRRLCPLIFSTLAEVLPASEWKGLTFLDPCVGGGSVALTAKAFGFRVIASDIAERALIVARGLVGNSDVRLSEADVLDLVLGAEAANEAAGRAPDLFPPEQARWLEGTLARAQRRGRLKAMASTIIYNRSSTCDELRDEAPQLRPSVAFPSVLA